MRMIYFLIGLVTYSFVSFSQNNKEYNKIDQVKLNGIIIKWQHYWNIHNMDSMGILLNENVDFVNVAGVWLRGKTETVNDHKQKHLGIVFKNSTSTTDSVETKYIKSDVAAVHLCWGIAGDNDPDSTPRIPRHGIFTWVVVKEHNEWKILTAQNTNKREQT